MASPVEALAAEFRPCVLVPVYDNAATVGQVVRGARARGFEVIVVDDGSRDGSGDRAAEEGGLVVRHPENRGKGAALKTGFAEARSRGFTHVASIDADGQHFPEDIPALLDAARASPDALVVGARDFASQEHVQRKSSFGRAFSNFWIWFETGVRVADSQCGLRVYPLRHMACLPLGKDRFDFEVEVIVRAAWAGLPVLSVPVKVHYPPPEERVSHFDVLRDNARITLLNSKLVLRRFLPWPHRKLVKPPKVTLRERVRSLASENATPLGLGLAVAFGCVIATTPFLGLQTLLAVLGASLLRLNKVATLVGSFVTTPPLTVPIVGASIGTGQFLLHGTTRAWPSPDEIGWDLVHAVFREWLLGGFVVGAGLGVLLGGITALVIARTRRP